MSPTRELCV
jgi:ATP-dependent RNA helicase DDX47/RRP3